MRPQSLLEMHDTIAGMPRTPLGDISLERMVRAVEKVRERLLRAMAALEKAGLPYAVAGGNAVAAWVSRVDVSAVRNTQDVDLLLHRSDLEAAAEALVAAGFVRRHLAGIEVFLDTPEARPREVVHIVFAGEKVRPEHPLPAPDVSESERNQPFRVLTLEALVRMHLRDLVEIGLLNRSWVRRLPTMLSDRLRSVLETPEG